MGSFRLTKIAKMRSRASPPGAKAAPPSSVGVDILSSASTLSSAHSGSATSVAGNLSPIDFELVGRLLRAERRPIPECVEARPPAAAPGSPPRPRAIGAPSNGRSSSIMENFRPVIEIGQESDSKGTVLAVEVLEGIHSFSFGGPYAVTIYLYSNEGNKRVATGGQLKVGL